MTDLEAGTDKRELLKSLDFGRRVAEDEVDELASYFVETEQWEQVWSGRASVVYGPKGSGKSAIYATLVARRDVLFDRGVLLAPAVEPRGNAAFEGLVEEPPTSEQEFVNLWKLYFLVLIADVLEEWEVRAGSADRLFEILEETGLRVGVGRRSLTQHFRSVRDYLARLLRPKDVEPKVHLDPNTGAVVAFSNKISFAEPSASERTSGVLPIRELFELADEALQEADFNLWILLDRLDVAFEGSQELEANALRALFRVHLDMLTHKRLRLKIFLRTDIWHSITAGGFREASHITNDLTLSWDRSSLLRLIVQRMLQSGTIVQHYAVDAADVLRSDSEQQIFFNRVFPLQVESGSRKRQTFDWAMSRTQDGTGLTAPRELIHLLNQARTVQIKRLEQGHPAPPGEHLFSGGSLREGLPEVSDARLTRTLYAEFPDVRPWLEALRGAKTQHNVASVQAAWGVDEALAEERADRLVEVGFFERRGPLGAPLYWVPFLYRPALALVQGSAEGVAAPTSDEDDDDLTLFNGDDLK